MLKAPTGMQAAVRGNDVFNLMTMSWGHKGVETMGACVSKVIGLKLNDCLKNNEKSLKVREKHSGWQVTGKYSNFYP